METIKTEQIKKGTCENCNSPNGILWDKEMGGNIYFCEKCNPKQKISGGEI